MTIICIGDLYFVSEKSKNKRLLERKQFPADVFIYKKSAPARETLLQYTYSYPSMLLNCSISFSMAVSAAVSREAYQLCRLEVLLATIFRQA